jgi:multiple sugar transport system substrate-binding protein
MNRYLRAWLVMSLVSAISPAVALQKVELSFAIWSDNPLHLGLLRQIAADYSSEHPSVSVRFVPIVPYSSFSREITLRVAGSDPPDAGWMLERLAPQFIDSGALLDISQAGSAYDLLDFSSSSLALWRRGKALYGLPFSTSPFFMICNKDLFARAGLADPEHYLLHGQWTWEGFSGAAKSIKETTGAYGYSFWMDDDPIFALSPLLRAYGADAWNDDGKYGMDTPGGLAALRLFHRMAAVDKSMVPPDAKSDFFAGDVATTIAQLSMVDRLREAPFSWEILPLPSGPAGKVGLIGQAAVVVFASARHPREAADFAAFMTSRSSMLKSASFFPSSRASVYESEAFLRANPDVPRSQMERAVVESLRSGRVLPASSDYGEIDPIMRSYFPRFFDEGTDIRALAAEIGRAIGPYIGKNR